MLKNVVMSSSNRLCPGITYLLHGTKLIQLGPFKTFFGTQINNFWPFHIFVSLLVAYGPILCQIITCLIIWTHFYLIYTGGGGGVLISWTPFYLGSPPLPIKRNFMNLYTISPPIIIPYQPKIICQP